MRQPRFLIDEAHQRLTRQAGDKWRGQRMFLHVAVSRIVEHVIGMAGAQQIKEVPPLFDDRVPNQVNQSLPICVQNPFLPA
jgi:hypothetical protein